MNDLSEWTNEPAESASKVSPARRLIGASCGAFVFCFVALMVCYESMDQIGIQATTMLSIAASIFGAIGGFAFPRFSHFLGYAFLLFVNVMLSITIGTKLQEQLILFCIFAFIEYVFFLSRKAT